MIESSNIRNGGIVFVRFLMIYFIVLKLTGLITWSWLWVLSPIWIILSLDMLILLVVFIINCFQEK